MTMWPNHRSAEEAGIPVLFDAASQLPGTSDTGRWRLKSI